LRRLLIAVCLLGMPCISWAQANRGSWEALDSLHAGQRIEVVEMSLKKHRGTFVTVSDEAIQLREGASDEAIKKENVMRVTVLDKGHRWRNALIFCAVGAGVGAGIGAAAAGKCFCTRGQAAEAVAGVGLVGGAVIGVALPTHDTIYRAKQH
jgi:hypothetical protein